MNFSNSSRSNAQVLVLDVGMTNAKAFVVDELETIIASARQPLTSFRPMPDWVEQDPVEILEAAQRVLREAYDGRSGKILAMGIANQRESALVWSPIDGRPLYPVISRQDRRTQDECHDINRIELNRQLVRSRTGLRIDPAFSATKMHWLTNRIESLGTYMGTIDSWLLYNLAEGSPYLTDRTNASRTLLFNIRDLGWDSDLLSLFGLHETLLPEVKPSFSNFGTLKKDVVGEELPIHVMIGDQQASMYAAGNTPSVIKVTYGAEMFVMKTLTHFELREDTLTALAVGRNDEPLYALEDAIGSVGSRITPLLDNPGKLRVELEKLAVEVAASLQIVLDQDDKRIIIDGGITNAVELPEIQAQVLSGIRVDRQSSPEGVALGVAKLLFDRMG